MLLFLDKAMRKKVREKLLQNHVISTSYCYQSCKHLPYILELLTFILNVTDFVTLYLAKACVNFPRFGTAVRSSESRYSENWRQSQNSVQDLYATVQKKRAGPTTSNAHNTDDEKSTGFEINDSIHPIEMERNYHVLSGEYNEVEILPLSSENIKPKQTSSESESTDGKSINELNAEAIIEQINVEAEPTPRDISSFRHSENPYETVKEEENGIPNELINHEENYTKF